VSNETNFFQIEIPKRDSHCKQCQTPLVPNMEYYSILLPENEGYQRCDFCSSCWEKSAKEKFSSSSVKTAWKAKVAAKKEVEDLSTKTRDEKAIYLLKEGLQNPENDWAETFILALYLARRRILYLRQEIHQEDGSTLCIYEVASTEEMLPIRRQSLIGINFEEIQTKIAEKMKGKRS
jgi:hypothetical protein